MSLIEILIQGGWLMIFIAAASIVVIALGISRFIALRRESDQLSKFLLEWNDVPATVDQSK